MSADDKPPLVVEGVSPSSGDTDLWNRHAAELERAALPAVRASAERWTAALAGLLGAVGLAAILDGAKRFSPLDEPWQSLGKWAFFLAAACAFVAALKAAVAAQVTSRKVFVGAAAGFREASKLAVADALGKLKWSRGLAVAAAGLVFVSAGLVWFAPTEPSGPQRIDIHGVSGCQEPSVDVAKLTVPDSGLVVVRCFP